MSLFVTDVLFSLFYVSCGYYTGDEPKIRNIPPNFFADFISAEEEEEALSGESGEEDEFIFIKKTRIFSRRALARISEVFEEAVPLYRGDVFRSHFRMTRTTLETFCQMLAPSEHVPKGNAFGRQPIEPQKQLAVAVWALANQESCLQISGLSLKVGRGRGTRGLGDVGREDLGT